MADRGCLIFVITFLHFTSFNFGFDVRLARYKRGPRCDFDLCINEPNYPKEEISQIMQNNTYMDLFLAQLMGEEREPFGSRSGLDDNKNICPVSRFTLQPRYGRTIEGDWKYIVNVDNYIQFLEIDTCNSKSNKKRICKEKRGSCQQTFIEIPMLTYDKYKDSLGYDRFRVPKNCICNPCSLDKF